MELCSILCASLDGKGVCGRMDTCICMAESLHGSPETTTILLICYTPIQNVFGFKKLKLKKNLPTTRAQGQIVSEVNSTKSLKS